MVVHSLLKKLNHLEMASSHSLFWRMQYSEHTLAVWKKLLINVLLVEKSKGILAFSDIFHLMMVVLAILCIMHLLIYPFFYSYIPAMLKRIGFGLLLPPCSLIMSAVAGSVMLCSSQTNVIYLFFHSEMFNIISNGPWWIFFPIVVYNLGLLFSVIPLFELVFTQTPNSM